MYTKGKLYKVLDEVIDPELGVGVYSLGLIYGVVIHFKNNEEGGTPELTEVTMTLTSPFCPYADVILEQVESAITLGGFGTPKITLTFDPLWQAGENLRTMLGI